MTAPTSSKAIENYRFVGWRKATWQLDLSQETLKHYRRTGQLLESIHWVRINSRLIRYNLPLLIDWLQNFQSDPAAHQRAIDIYLSLLPCNQPKPRASLLRK